MSILKGKVILVTGGTGSMGSEITRYALKEGAKRVIVLSRDEIKHFILRKRLQDERLEHVIGDIRDFRVVEGVFTRFPVDIIYHAAAMKHVVMCEEFPLQAVETNILGTQNIVDLALKYRVAKMITVSTDKAAYPVNVMGASKFIAERMTLNANRISSGGQAFSCVRYGNVAISRGSVIPIYIDNLLHRKPIQVTDYEVTRFIMGIPEAIGLVVEATEYARGDEIFILKMKAFRLKDLVEVILTKIAPRLGISPNEIEVRHTGLLKGEKLDEDLISRIEAQHLYELGEMFVVLEDDRLATRYKGIKKMNLSEYTSRGVSLISKDEIEEIVTSYLKEQLTSGELQHVNGINP